MECALSIKKRRKRIQQKTRKEPEGVQRTPYFSHCYFLRYHFHGYLFRIRDQQFTQVLVQILMKQFDGALVGMEATDRSDIARTDS